MEIDWLWLRTFQEFVLSDEQARALVFVREVGAISNAALRAIAHIDVLSASQHLRRLRRFDLLQQKGKGAQTYYVPSEKLRVSWTKPDAARITSENESPALAALLGTPPVSGNLAGQSGNPSAESGNLARQSGKVSPESGKPAAADAFPPELPPELRKDLLALGARARKSNLEHLVSRLCQWRDLAAGDLAGMLRRDRKYVQDRLLTPMVKAGRLNLTIPEQPNHPGQKYRALASEHRIA